jgi:hypothetical protein
LGMIWGLKDQDVGGSMIDDTIDVMDDTTG